MPKHIKAVDRIAKDRDANPEDYRWIGVPNADKRKVNKQILRWRAERRALKAKEAETRAYEKAVEYTFDPLPLVKNIFYNEEGEG